MASVQTMPSAQPVAAGDAHFVVGQDVQGRWLALETHNLCGGLFRSREAALHFADGETGHRPGAVDLATLPLQLSF